MYSRNIASRLIQALKDTPVVLIIGARQTGKSTLAQLVTEKEHPALYYTLDNVMTLSAIQADVQGFVGQVNQPVILDEVQRAPELFVAIKEAIDKKRSPGQFLLTGSANVLLLPNISESLAGRMEIINLWPLSQGEIKNKREKFIETVFAKEFVIPAIKKMARDDLYQRILVGGYPEVLARNDFSRQQAWFGSYITAILQRDVRELAQIEGLTVFPKLLSLLANRAAALFNQSELSRSMGIPLTTLIRYLTLLEATFLIYKVQPWSSNKNKRLVKTPKVYFCDSGLLSHLRGANLEYFETDPFLIGSLLENFVITELKKQLTWSDIRAQLYYYRTQTGQEVDAILENAAGFCVGVEIKASATVTEKDFNGLRSFAELAGKKFMRGFVLYTGNQVVPFGDNLFAVPVNFLWD